MLDDFLPCLQETGHLAAVYISGVLEIILTPCFYEIEDVQARLRSKSTCVAVLRQLKTFNSTSFFHIEGIRKQW